MPRAAFRRTPPSGCASAGALGALMLTGTLMHQCADQRAKRPSQPTPLPTRPLVLLVADRNVLAAALATIAQLRAAGEYTGDILLVRPDADAQLDARAGVSTAELAALGVRVVAARALMPRELLPPEPPCACWLAAAARSADPLARLHARKRGAGWSGYFWKLATLFSPALHAGALGNGSRRILYVDAGIIVRQPIAPMLALPVGEGRLLAHSDTYPTYDRRLSSQMHCAGHTRVRTARARSAAHTLGCAPCAAGLPAALAEPCAELSAALPAAALAAPPRSAAAARALASPRGSAADFFQSTVLLFDSTLVADGRLQAAALTLGARLLGVSDSDQLVLNALRFVDWRELGRRALAGAADLPGGARARGVGWHRLRADADQLWSPLPLRAPLLQRGGTTLTYDYQPRAPHVADEYILVKVDPAALLGEHAARADGPSAAGARRRPRCWHAQSADRTPHWVCTSQKVDSA
ncbi:hypothetical protein KFE25_001125 [Diacronema lutheri]|uniref:Uncharacterized protein n=1 Tax=Diacronema lutheri TaxID=2081491 RepID=A0A8J5X9T7_DIALT|nr:hypothetical protein KFE25_001125 [Diacronema lutheri]